jgi:hypothetical protein
VSTIPELPLTLVQSLERRMVTAAAAATSPFTGTSQVQDWGGAWWEYDLEMAVTQGAPARRLSAFFAALGGIRGRFLLRDPSHLAPLGGGLPYVTEVPADRNTLRTAGWGLGIGSGNFFTLGSGAATRFYQLTEDVVPVGSEALLRFTPQLRSLPPIGTILEVQEPKVLLRLTGPVPTRIARADSHRFTLSAREAL